MFAEDLAAERGCECRCDVRMAVHCLLHKFHVSIQLGRGKGTIWRILVIITYRSDWCRVFDYDGDFTVVIAKLGAVVEICRTDYGDAVVGD
jgi:hypothetical protein